MKISSVQGQVPVSVVIPTFNEEKYLGKLLDSLLLQTYQNFEVIVSDGDSEDGTKEVFEKFKLAFEKRNVGFKFVLSKIRSPGAQRNAGAKMANFSRILFLDADVTFDGVFLERAVLEIEKNGYDLAHARLVPMGNGIFYKILFKGLHHGLKLISRKRATAGAAALFSSREIHDLVGGFDESLRLGEDIQYLLEASKKKVSMNILDDASVFVSMRRLDREGKLGSIFLTFYHEALFMKFGIRRAQKFIQREYGNY